MPLFVMRERAMRTEKIAGSVSRFVRGGWAGEAVFWQGKKS
jgi:hypothetical protein